MGEFDALLRRYVLGALGEEERLKLEEQLITDQRLFEGLGLLEHELMEEYLEGSLPEGDRRQFESGFLADPEHRHQLEFMRLVRQTASRPASSPAPPALASPAVHRPAPAIPVWMRFAAAAVVTLSAVGFWLCFRQAGGRLELAALRTANEATTEEVRLTREQLVVATAQIEELRRSLAGPTRMPGAGPDAPPMLHLAGHLSRSQGELPRLYISPEAQVVRIEFELPVGSHSTYRVVIRDSDDEAIWERSKLSGQKGAGHVTVRLTLPAEDLPVGDYRAKVAGSSASGTQEEIDTFSFRVNVR